MFQIKSSLFPASGLEGRDREVGRDGVERPQDPSDRREQVQEEVQVSIEVQVTQEIEVQVSEEAEEVEVAEALEEQEPQEVGIKVT